MVTHDTKKHNTIILVTKSTMDLGNPRVCNQESRIARVSTSNLIRTLKCGQSQVCKREISVGLNIRRLISSKNCTTLI